MIDAKVVSLGSTLFTIGEIGDGVNSVATILARLRDGFGSSSLASLSINRQYKINTLSKNKSTVKI